MLTIQETDLNYAYKYCEEITKKHYENFPVGSLLIPKAKKKYIYSIYAYARTADDVADSDKYKEKEKLIILDSFNVEFDKIEKDELCDLNSNRKQIFIALSNTIKDLSIPIKEFRDLLVAFKQDAVKQKYETFDELISYSNYSANPIGHLVLYVFKYNPKADKRIFDCSNKICTALQLTNFWQDVSIDLNISRMYIPSKIMTRFNYSEKMLFDKIENQDFRNTIRFLVEKTLELYEEGKEIIDLVNGRLRLELKATIEGGLAILNKIEKINYNVLNKRVTINNYDKVKILGNIFWK